MRKILLLMILVVATLSAVSAFAGTVPGSLSFSNNALLRPEGESEPAIGIASDGTIFYDQFTAGGFTNLDAYKYQEFRGNSMFTGGAGVIYRGSNPRNLTLRPYLASWYEAGRLDLGSRGWQTVQSTSTGILAPTPVGIMGLSVSFDQQGRARFRLSLGSFWNRR